MRVWVLLEGQVLGVGSRGSKFGWFCGGEVVEVDGLKGVAPEVWDLRLMIERGWGMRRRSCEGAQGLWVEEERGRRAIGAMQIGIRGIGFVRIVVGYSDCESLEQRMNW